MFFSFFFGHNCICISPSDGTRNTYTHTHSWVYALDAGLSATNNTQLTRNAQAQACVRLEAPGRRPHVDGGRLERELEREHQPAVVEAAMVWRVLGAAHAVVPLEDVVGQRLGADVRHRIALQPHVVLAQARRRADRPRRRHGHGLVVC